MEALNMEDEFVLVPILVEWLPDVYRLLGSLAEKKTDSSKIISQESPEELIIRAYNESHGHMKAVLDYLIENPDKEMTVKDLSNYVNLDSFQFRGVLGAFGRRCSSHYKTKDLLFQVKRRGNKYFYVMPKQIAEIINREKERIKV